MITWHQLLQEGKERLYQANQSDQAALLLLNELCSHRNINLYMVMDEPVNEQVQTDYLEAIHRMEKGEPLGYVLGYENFYGYDFIVNEDVLIPRPETEELTGQVLMLCDDVLEKIEHPVVFDVATGSGAIGITLSLEEPRLDVYASDISQKALEVAYMNNEKLGGRVVFVQGDMLQPFVDRNMHCDVLVCNPPYIPQEEKLDHGVVDYEPNVALFGGEDGLYFYRSVFKNAHKVLNENGIMAFEMGYDQGERLSALAKQYFPEADVQVLQDISQKDRILVVRT
ncbi:peptide chain release factor N(5)-glutamine methyltransferase [Allobaculum stercoricanis]|uniref:peptide chain release factor N(5)-glutamine methyltransferase n=1 Tax=Allobaculum stercoricanis TaxID=174709 RepID=UPI0023F11DF5|nr:peptide chain release factor N(5)-glutamine methyltransferase [Allobaculum stercoricanis]